MSKKIVVITGSPRKNGNSFWLDEAFKSKSGGGERGNIVTQGLMPP